MIKALLTTAAIAACLALAIPTAASAAQDCESLRQACLMKDSLGEKGKGNCKAYRNSGCADQRPNFGGGFPGGGGGIGMGGGGGGGGFGPGAGHCFKLQQACANKDALGLTGLGVCKRFRNECT
jgi:hypothetical protein